MLELLNEGAITIDDLEEFSDDLKETISHQKSTPTSYIGGEFSVTAL